MNFTTKTMQNIKRTFGSKKKQETSEEIKHKAAEFEAYMSSFEKCKKRVQESLDMVKAGSFSWDSIKEFTDSLRDIDGVLVGYILKLKVGILDSKPARDLVDVYFRVSVQTLELLNELEDCLRVAGNDQLTLRLAAKKFVNKKYPETLEKMEKFKAKEDEDPFKKFWPLYDKLCQQQISSLDKVMDLHRDINKPPLPKPKEDHQEADDPSANEWNKETKDQVDAASETDVATDKHLQHPDDVVEEPELKCVVIEFENYRVLALSLAEKITSLSAGTTIDDNEAESVVNNLDTEINKFTAGTANMTDHTLKCRNDIFSGREKVLGLIMISA